MRNLFICCDGTWNTPTDLADGVPVPTNVYKFYASIAAHNPDGLAQLKYYHPGVGTEGNKIERIVAGAVGSGLDANIKSAYKWLADTYQLEDQVYLIGFSRGAYTARSLGGFLSACGLLNLDNSGWERVDQAFALYRRRARGGDAVAQKELDNDRAAFRQQFCVTDVKIHFIGVWDTVGALGIPRNLDWLNLDDWNNQSFHDLALSPIVENAYHAVAIDEQRASFAPTLWIGPFLPTQHVEQVWFPGVHADVGGGYKEVGLSDGALWWMIENAERCGAGFEPKLCVQVRPDPRGVLHDSFQGAFKLIDCQPRSMPEIVEGNGNIHPSTIDRQTNPPITQALYRPSRRLQPGESLSVSIYANEMWNAVHLFLGPGETYAFQATGQWVNEHATSDPDGVRGGLFNLLS